MDGRKGHRPLVRAGFEDSESAGSRVVLAPCPYALTTIRRSGLPLTVALSSGSLSRFSLCVLRIPARHC